MKYIKLLSIGVCCCLSIECNNNSILNKNTKSTNLRISNISIPKLGAFATKKFEVNISPKKILNTVYYYLIYKSVQSVLGKQPYFYKEFEEGGNFYSMTELKNCNNFNIIARIPNIDIYDETSLLQFDEFGNFKWGKMLFNIIPYEDGYEIIETTNKDLVIASNIADKDICIEINKLNQYGEPLWKRSLLKDNCKQISSLFETKNGNYIITILRDDHYSYIVNYDKEGNKKWDVTLSEHQNYINDGKSYGDSLIFGGTVYNTSDNFHNTNDILIVSLDEETGKFNWDNVYKDKYDHDIENYKGHSLIIYDNYIILVGTGNYDQFKGNNYFYSNGILMKIPITKNAYPEAITMIDEAVVNKIEIIKNKKKDGFVVSLINNMEDYHNQQELGDNKLNLNVLKFKGVNNLEWCKNLGSICTNDNYLQDKKTITMYNGDIALIWNKIRYSKKIPVLAKISNKGYDDKCAWDCNVVPRPIDTSNFKVVSLFKKTNPSNMEDRFEEINPASDIYEYKGKFICNSDPDYAKKKQKKMLQNMTIASMGCRCLYFLLFLILAAAVFGIYKTTRSRRNLTIAESADFYPEL